MKTRYWIITVAALLILIFFAALWYQHPTVKPFSLENYQYYVESFDREGLLDHVNGDATVFDRYDQIDSGREAINAAKKIWRKFYDGVGFYRPYRVYFDETNQTWLVTSSVFFFLEDGPSLIISSDGEVLAMWKHRL